MPDRNAIHPLHWLATLRDDVRFALRHFRRTPFTTATLLLVLAIGVGSHAALFAFVQAVVTRPVAGITASKSLVRIRGTELYDSLDTDRYLRPLSYPELNEIAARRDLFTAVSGWSTSPITLALDSASTVRTGTAHFITPDLFATLHVTRATAAGLSAAGTDDVQAVISDQTWRDVFGASPNAIGAALQINGVTARIVGITPRGFQGPIGSEGDRPVWLNINARPAILGTTAVALASRDSALFNAVARLSPGVSLAAANRALTDIAAHSVRAMNARPNRYHIGIDAVVLRGNTILPVWRSEDAFYIKYGASVATIILILVCVNVAALQIGAARPRRREIAIRISLGATRARIVRQLLTESVLVAAFGGGVGLGIYTALIHLLLSHNSTLQLNADIGTGLYTLMFAAVTGIVCGLAPALHATQVEPGEIIKDGGRTTPARSRLHDRFIIAQVTLTQPFMLMIGLMIGQVVVPELGRGTNTQASTHLIDLQNLWWTTGVPYPQSQQMARSGIDAVRRLPGVTSVAPVRVGSRGATITVLDPHGAGKGERIVHGEYVGSAPGLLQLMGTPIVAGRGFVAADSGMNREPIIVSMAFAKRLFGNDAAVGKVLRLAMRGGTHGDEAIVIGVAAPTANGTLPQLRDFVVIDRDTTASSGYLISTAGPADAIIPAVEATWHRAAPRLGIDIASVAARDAAAWARWLWIGVFASGCALVTLLLCSLGLYAIVALAVQLHRREIGVRMALGARNRQVIGIFVGRGMQLVARGILYGMPISLLVMLAIVPSPLWRGSIGAALAVTTIVAVVAALASWIPAYRASHVTPMVAMRGE